jgi:hypothetical protein
MMMMMMMMMMPLLLKIPTVGSLHFLIDTIISNTVLLKV